jgi:hypothetical protein
MSKKKHYEDDFLKLSFSLHEILRQAGSLGYDGNTEKFARVLNDILKRKQKFTEITGAWEQYQHLADWLVEIANRIPIKGTKIEESYLSAATHSFNNSSKKKLLGYAWQAYIVWNSNWDKMRLDNRKMLIEFIKNEKWDKSSEIEKVYL